MATTVVEICNIALSRIGAKKIQSLDDTSKEAEECNLHYENARDATLRDFDWSFARKRADLAVLTDTFTGWTYAYQLPSDYIMARKIIDDTGSLTGTSYDIDTDNYKPVGRVKFEIVSNNAGNRPILLTDKEDAELSYTARITDSNAFDPMFADALSWRLASEFAISIRGKLDLQLNLLKVYQAVLSMAKANSAREDNNKTDDQNPYVRSRG